MSDPNSRARAPTRMSQRPVKNPKSTLQLIVQSIISCFCSCWAVEGYDRPLRYDRDRPRRGSLPPAPPPSRATSSREVPDQPRRPSTYELDAAVEQRLLPSQGHSTADRRPASSRRRGPGGGKLLPIVTDSPTARIVSPEQDFEEHISSGCGLPQAASLQQDVVVEQVQEHKHLAELREATRQGREPEPELPVSEGASMYNEAPTSARDENFVEEELPECPGIASSVGLHFQDIQRGQQRLDDMRGIGEATTPSPPPRASPSLSSPAHGASLSVRRRLEAQEQAELTRSSRGYAAGQTTSAGQPVEPLQVISGNARKFPAPRATPRPISEYVSPSQIVSPPQSREEQTRNVSQ